MSAAFTLSHAFYLTNMEDDIISSIHVNEHTYPLSSFHENRHQSTRSNAFFHLHNVFSLCHEKLFTGNCRYTFSCRQLLPYFSFFFCFYDVIRLLSKEMYRVFRELRFTVKISTSQFGTHIIIYLLLFGDTNLFGNKQINSLNNLLTLCVFIQLIPIFHFTLISQRRTSATEVLSSTSGSCPESRNESPFLSYSPDLTRRPGDTRYFLQRPSTASPVIDDSSYSGRSPSSQRSSCDESSVRNAAGALVNNANADLYYNSNTSGRTSRTVSPGRTASDSSLEDSYLEINSQGRPRVLRQKRSLPSEDSLHANQALYDQHGYEQQHIRSQNASQYGSQHHTLPPLPPTMYRNSGNHSCIPNALPISSPGIRHISSDATLHFDYNSTSPQRRKSDSPSRSDYSGVTMTVGQHQRHQIFGHPQSPPEQCMSPCSPDFSRSPRSHSGDEDLLTLTLRKYHVAYIMSWKYVSLSEWFIFLWKAQYLYESFLSYFDSMSVRYAEKIDSKRIRRCGCRSQLPDIEGDFSKKK